MIEEEKKAFNIDAPIEFIPLFFLKPMHDMN